MRAKKGEWFSLSWDVNDKFREKSFEQLKESPRFLFAEKDSKDIGSLIINEFDFLRLVRIFLTTVFIKDADGKKLPTHYRPGEFMPGDDPIYDDWLLNYHKVNQGSLDAVRSMQLIFQKDIFLEYSSKLIRHDMHSGINTYIPRGFSSLLKKLPDEVIRKHKLQSSLNLLAEGIKHAQKVYKGVYSFTNLVKKRPQVEKKMCNISNIITDHLEKTSYKDKVDIQEDLGLANVNETLFCVAIDNFVRNGLSYNDSKDKKIKIYQVYEEEILIQDNGVGLEQHEYDLLCMPFMRESMKTDQITGVGINIANAILDNHGFKVYIENPEEGGTCIHIRM